jgi:hypothetical protein
MTVVLDSLSGIDWYTRMSAHADPVIGDVMPGLPAFSGGAEGRRRHRGGERRARGRLE